MTPETIKEAAYELGQAAETQADAKLGGAELGQMLAAQFRALGVQRQRSFCASPTAIERTLVELTTRTETHYADVAWGALDAWRRETGTG